MNRGVVTLHPVHEDPTMGVTTDNSVYKAVSIQHTMGVVAWLSR